MAGTQYQITERNDRDSQRMPPNAYGEVSKAGAYASNLAYHPNGSIKSLTYGNGRVYTTTQNSRRLPAELKVTLSGTDLVKLTYEYDANANIEKITDAVDGNAKREMTYDGLDRLKTASGRWGAGNYSHGVLSNLQFSWPAGPLQCRKALMPRATEKGRTSDLL